jgi:hypothetical protein
VSVAADGRAGGGVGEGGGCTDCGRKGGCDHRKGEMFAAIDQAMARLYPTQRWDQRHDDGAALGEGVARALTAALAERGERRLDAPALLRPGGPDELCDFVYFLCFGRRPSLLELREGVASPSLFAGAGPLEELHLRVALSAVAPFAAVQQVTLRLHAAADDGGLFVDEAPRAGVFDPVLLPRMRKLVAVLAELGVRHLDFGEISAPPDGYHPGDYGDRYGAGALPALANYLFFPQPTSAITTTAIAVAPGGSP